MSFLFFLLHSKNSFLGGKISERLPARAHNSQKEDEEAEQKNWVERAKAQNSDLLAIGRRLRSIPFPPAPHMLRSLLFALLVSLAVAYVPGECKPGSP